MTKPQLKFKFTDTDRDHRLEQIITEKLEALSKYYEEPTLLEVEFRKEAPKQNGQVFVVEVNCSVKGELYRATATKESFEKAIDAVRNEIDKELRRTRKKRNNLFLKGARKIKEMMRVGR